MNEHENCGMVIDYSTTVLLYIKLPVARLHAVVEQLALTPL